LFSSKNTGCLLADQWEDKYLYWEICRCDLWNSDGDDTTRPRRVACWLLNPSYAKPMKQFVPPMQPHSRLNLVKNQSHVLVIQCRNFNYGSQPGVTEQSMTPSLCVIQYPRHQITFPVLSRR
jgi:hypothetical protein